MEGEPSRLHLRAAGVQSYQILAKIGAGGTREFFRARDISLERDVALKFLAENLRQERVGLERFVREGKSAPPCPTRTSASPTRPSRSTAFP